MVSQKVAAQAVPLIGAAGGGAINVLFMNHFQQMARSHFIVRRLERAYGAEVIRAERSAGVTRWAGDPARRAAHQLSPGRSAQVMSAPRSISRLAAHRNTITPSSSSAVRVRRPSLHRTHVAPRHRCQPRRS